MKKAIALLLAGAMCAGILTACGGSSSSAPAKEETAAETEAAGKEATA